MIPARLIERKRNGFPLDAHELEAFFSGYLSGEVQEPQMSAFLMAVYFRGLDQAELDALVGVMLASGQVLDHASLAGPAADKHSTGGVGDKVSLVLAPLAASLGLYVPMIAGRGLGHTGGTLDKVEAIPGFQTTGSASRLRSVLDAVGCAIVGQSSEIAPLDRRLYALRDVTATVPSIPLIAASIMSKKLAEDLDGLVLDVKVGEGAFLQEEARARELADALVGIGTRHGVPTRALMTAMDRPLGHTVGNALEVKEAIDCLRGGGPPDLRELVLELTAEMVLVVGAETGRGQAREAARLSLDSGRALERFQRMVEAQGGDPRVVDDPTRLPGAEETGLFRAEKKGFLASLTPTVLGYGLIELGGGRTRLGDAVDPSVGFVLHASVGQAVSPGEPIATVYAADGAGVQTGLETLRRAVVIADDSGGVPSLLPLVLRRVAEQAA